MTTRLSDYGIRGPWQLAECDGCGKRRSCLMASSVEETLAICMLCVLADIETMERQQVEHYAENLAADNAERLAMEVRDA